MTGDELICDSGVRVLVNDHRGLELVRERHEVKWASIFHVSGNIKTHSLILCVTCCKNESGTEPGPDVLLLGPSIQVLLQKKTEPCRKENRTNKHLEGETEAETQGGRTDGHGCL